MKIRLALALLAAPLLAAASASSCAGLPKPGAALGCADRCASVSCPGDLVCTVDARCVAVCQPRPVPVARH